MRPYRYSRARSGMTILEMMVALAILLTMSTVVYMTLSESVEFNQLLGKRDATTRSARTALQKLRRELQLAYLTPARNNPETIQTVFVGEDGDPDKLYFATLAHQRLYMNSRECDQAEVTVWAESAPRDVGEGYILYHRESERVDEEPAESGRVHVLAYNVRSFNVRYLDPQTNEWADEWDTRGPDTPYRLPRAMEIGLVLIAEDPDDPDRTVDVPFLSRFTLEYGQRLARQAPGLADVTTGTSGVSTNDANASVGQVSRNRNPLPSLGGGAPWQMTQGITPNNRNNRNNRNRGNTRRSTPSRPNMARPPSRGGK